MKGAGGLTQVGQYVPVLVLRNSHQSIMALKIILSTSPTPPFPALYARKVRKEGAQMPLPYSRQVLPAQAEHVNSPEWV